MPSNLDYAGNWSNGAYVKAPYYTIDPATIINNLIRIIDANQNTFIAEIEGWSGQSVPKENASYYFHASSLHAAVIKDPNKNSICIDCQLSRSDSTGSSPMTFICKIYCKIGAGDYDKRVPQMGVLLLALHNLIRSAHPQELCYGWPANITESQRPKYQPTIAIGASTSFNPDESSDNTSVGPIGTLSFEVIARPKTT